MTKGFAHDDEAFIASQTLQTGASEADVRAGLCTLLDFTVMCVIDGSRRLIDRLSERIGFVRCCPPPLPYSGHMCRCVLR